MKLVTHLYLNLTLTGLQLPLNAHICHYGVMLNQAQGYHL
jgi:hypothetical protein